MDRMRLEEWDFLFRGRRSLEKHSPRGIILDGNRS